jgi:DNA adenine methylase
LRRFLPERFNRYYEPFLGGGALFFSLRPPLASLSDINGELVSCYKVVRDHPSKLVEALKQHVYEEKHFYEVRDRDPKRLSAIEGAARTIFLNKTAFNGLYRVNSRGEFNVPFGRYKRPQFSDPENLAACSEALRRVKIEVKDFEKALREPGEGDFVYLDPPYVPRSNTAYFTSYAVGGFDWEDQQRLAKVVKDLSKRGVKFMLSNSDVPSLRKLYKGFRIEGVVATRRINSRVEGRGDTPEIVVLNY